MSCKTLRGKKKHPIMLFQWQPALGHGTTKSSQKPMDVQNEEMRLNFIGSVEMTRFLCFAGLKETYSEDPGLLFDAMEAIAENFNQALTSGLKVRCDGVACILRIAVIAVKGDWPFLIEAGNMVRHFRRAPKKGDSRVPPAGICHLCLAGQPGYPFSDVSDCPAFEKTMGSAAAQLWASEPSAFTRMLSTDPEDLGWLYRPDVFHNFHLGHGRYMVGSCFVVLLPLFGKEATITAQLLACKF